MNKYSHIGFWYNHINEILWFNSQRGFINGNFMNKYSYIGFWYNHINEILWFNSQHCFTIIILFDNIPILGFANYINEIFII